MVYAPGIRLVQSAHRTSVGILIYGFGFGGYTGDENHGKNFCWSVGVLEYWKSEYLNLIRINPYQYAITTTLQYSIAPKE